MTIVYLHTTMGTIGLEMYTKHAPRTCANFIELARQGYYDNTIFHRVIKGFMIQGGDPSGTGYGGTSIYDDSGDGKKLFVDEKEALKTLRHTGAGVLAMANTGPDTNGSQFYVTLAPTPWLDKTNVVFGRVASGMGTIERIGQVAVDREDKPTTAVIVNRTEVEDDGDEEEYGGEE
ncbi:uncharacterized protein SAPINGB_P003698 [Magnusiomyces paraingens]|uniref:Peptidyl-prolyl cis-trans isomerase n=1 Tax=Magnusiomyces paraingens TaxID=2606893 RepID=A0A5E8BY48_9ASCO|nr:uncharacterized protein SAPINGB_P003698 [Saprochaete ingens]VVT53685.1 unnamed protein product [Saprochaete ingens]